MVNCKNYIKYSTKRIVYLLYKKTNRTLREFRATRSNDQTFEDCDKANLQILRRLKKKGLVGMSEYPSGNIYYLTDEGDKVAKPIVNEIDGYKQW